MIEASRPPFGGPDSDGVSFELFPQSTPEPLPRPSLHRKASHEIFSRLWLPTNFVRLPPLKGGARVRIENSCCPLRGHRVYGVKRRE